MNLLKRLWNWIIKKTSVSSTLDIIEEPCSEVFKRICNEAGVGDKRLAEVNAIELFEQWYDGTSDEESVRAAITDFKLDHPGVAAKLSGKL